MAAPLMGAAQAMDGLLRPAEADPAATGQTGLPLIGVVDDDLELLPEINPITDEGTQILHLADLPDQPGVPASASRIRSGRTIIWLPSPHSRLACSPSNRLTVPTKRATNGVAGAS